MTFRTRITRLLGIEYPIIQGAMHWLSRAELVAAVSEAGGLGILSSLTLPTIEELRQEIRKIQSLTNKPFAVNVTLLPTLRPVDYAGYIRAAIEEGVRIIETAGRNPRGFMPQLKEAGVTIMHKVARLRDAQAAEKVGVNAVTIVGFQEGGNPGMDEVASTILVPLAARSLDIPVIAAGGFVDGRGLVAALSLGAEGVMMGTRFMVSRECPLHQDIKERLVQATEKDTVLVMRSIGNPERVLDTEFARHILEIEARGTNIEELAPLVSGLRQKKVLDTGNIEEALLPCGQSIGLINDIPPAGEIVTAAAAEADQTAIRIRKTVIIV
jgi:nitronate monooxygenase